MEIRQKSPTSALPCFRNPWKVALTFCSFSILWGWGERERKEKCKFTEIWSLLSTISSDHRTSSPSYSQPQLTSSSSCKWGVNKQRRVNPTLPILTSPTSPEVMEAGNHTSLLLSLPPSPPIMAERLVAFLPRGSDPPHILQCLPLLSHITLLLYPM